MEGKVLYEMLQKAYPDGAAMGWDNVGVLCGRIDKEIKTVYIALDATMKVIDAAALAGADLILTHHPMIFSSIKRIEADDYVGGRIIKLLENGITEYAMHTNYDILRMADIVASCMGMRDLKVLEPVNAEGDLGIGYTGLIEKAMTLKELAAKIKLWFDIPDVRIYGDPETLIEKVSVCPGSAKGMEDFAIAQGGQVLIGGDFGHHEGLDCVEKGICVIDAGHYGLEHVFIDDMAEWLKVNCPELKVIKAPVSYPFITI